MKLKDAIAQVDRSPKNTNDADVDAFAPLFDVQIPWNNEFGKRVKKHWLYNWQCTDTWVGFAVYYMDSEPVAVSFQSARKSDEDIEFVSREAAFKVRDYLLTLMEPRENFSVVDVEEEIGDTYKVNYSSQILSDHGVYAGQAVRIVKKFHDMKEIDKWGKVGVVLPNNEEVTIETDDLHLPFHLASLAWD